jgi:cytochrome P450
MAEKDFPHASTVEGVRFTAQVGIPNVVQGIFRRRAQVVKVASRAGVDGLAVGFMKGLRRSYGDGPVWIRVAKDEALLVLGAEQIKHVLGGSPDPFASDPPPKKKGMEHFQPDALTISRQPQWEPRRKFTEAVLDTGKPVHRLADKQAAICVEEAERLVEGRKELDFDAVNLAVRRVTRRIILGDAAADDETVSEQLATLMDEANKMPGHDPSALRDEFEAKVRSYVDAAEAGSLVSLFAEAPAGPDAKPAGQVTHWMFALGDTLAINLHRCLAVLATHRYERAQVIEEINATDLSSGAAVAGMSYLNACIEEAMRLWPTTPMLSRITTREIEWDGHTVPEGTQVLIVNTFNHRNPETHEYADKFAPEAWKSGDAGSDWSFNHFSHGPQGCPGAGLALFVGKAMAATLLKQCAIELTSGSLEPGKLPHMLNYFTLKIGLTPRS